MYKLVITGWGDRGILSNSVTRGTWGHRVSDCCKMTNWKFPMILMKHCVIIEKAMMNPRQNAKLNLFVSYNLKH